MAQDNGPHRYRLTEDSITIDGKTFGAGWLLISEDEYKSLTTANPAQVTDAMVEKSSRAICVALGHDPNDWVAYRSEASAALLAAIGAGGQAVDVETIARAVDPAAWADDLPVPTRGDTIRFYERRQASFETARRILSVISNPPAQPVAWPYGGCELSSDVPCNPFDCCEICQVPGASKHANPPAQTAQKDKY